MIAAAEEDDGYYLLSSGRTVLAVILEGMRARARFDRSLPIGDARLDLHGP
jgi:hypothetical protein